MRRWEIKYDTIAEILYLRILFRQARNYFSLELSAMKGGHIMSEAYLCSGTPYLYSSWN
jgi:hypothetical protein